MSRSIEWSCSLINILFYLLSWLTVSLMYLWRLYRGKWELGEILAPWLHQHYWRPRPRLMAFIVKSEHWPGDCGHWDHTVTREQLSSSQQKRGAPFLLRHVLFQLPSTLACFHWTLKFKLSGFLYCSGLTFEYHVKYLKINYPSFCFFRDIMCETWMGKTNLIDSSKWQNNEPGNRKDWAFYFYRKWGSQSSNNDLFKTCNVLQTDGNPAVNLKISFWQQPTSNSHVSMVRQLW